VLVGSFIAAAFKDPFNAALFRIGVMTYAGYVVLFPGLVGLLASHLDLRAARAQFDRRRERFKETLLPEKVGSIVGTQVTDAERAFYQWLWTVAGCYLLAVTAAIAAALFVPRAIG
jgi:hypothetical protein